MKKDNIMFAVIGLLAGLIVGFMFANSVNRSALEKQPVATGSNMTSADRPNLPPDHPPIGSTTDAPQDGPLPQVTAAIDKARQEPKNYGAQMTAGDLYYQIKKYDDATKFYEIANKLRPAHSEPMI